MTLLPNWLRSAAPRPQAEPPGDAKSVVLGGIETLLDGAPGDPYFQAVEQQAAHMDGFAAFLAPHVPPKATVLDVGANIGSSTILLARAAKRVIDYEPSPPNVGILRRNLGLNGIGNLAALAARIA